MLNKNIRRKGISALPIVLIMAFIILEVAISGLLASSLLSNDLGGEQASIKALEIAKSGANDAIYRIRSYCTNGSTGDAPDPCPTVYDLSVGSNLACININPISDGEMVIYSKGIVWRREKFVKVILEVDTSNGSVDIKFFKEIEDPGVAFTDC